MSVDSPNFVARHDIGLPREALADIARDRLAGLDTRRTYAVARPQSLTGFAREAHCLAGYYHAAQPDAPEVGVFLRLTARALAAAAARAVPGAGPVRIDLGETGPLELPPSRQAPPSLRDIVNAYHAAFASSDGPALALLDNLPLEHFVAIGPGVEEGGYALAHVRGLQLLSRGDIAGHALLIAAIKGCGSEALDRRVRYHALLLESPEIELTLIHGEPDGSTAGNLLPFNAALLNALLLHRQYYSHGVNDRDPEGFIALGPLAWATLRHDRGLPVTVTSDYLPRSVLEGHRRDS